MSYILIVFLLFCSAFFSGTEIAYTALNKLKLKKEGEPATRLEKLVSYIYNHYDRALSTVLIGNNLVNIAATSTATVIAVNLALASGGKLDDDTASGIVTIIMTVLILIFGEITPKMVIAIGQSNAVRILIPVNQCDNQVVGVNNYSVSYLIRECMEMIRKNISNNY